MPDLTSTLLAMCQYIIGGSTAREQAAVEAEACRRLMLSGLQISPAGVITIPGFAPGGAHHATHELGGLDMVNVTGLTGLLATPQVPVGHHATHELGGSDVVNVTGLLGLLAAPQTPLAHHLTHQAGGSDGIALDTLVAPSDITTLNATTSAHGLLQKLPGGTTTFLRGDGTFAALPAVAARIAAIGIVIDGGGSVLTTGVKGFVEVPFAGTITAATLLSTDAAVTSGSIVVDIWKAAYAGYPPVVGNTITASAPPTLSSATKSRDVSLAGWTTAIAAGDILGFSVTSVTALTRVALSLTVQAS